MNTITTMGALKVGSVVRVEGAGKMRYAVVEMSVGSGPCVSTLASGRWALLRRRRFWVILVRRALWKLRMGRRG